MQLRISYTKREWLKVHKEISKRGKTSVLSLLISEIKRLDEVTDRLPICDEVSGCNKIKKRAFYPPPESVEILNRISIKLSLPPSTIVSRFIINPLLSKE